MQNLPSRLRVLAILATTFSGLAAFAADEQVKLTCNVSIETTWGKGYKVENSREMVLVTVERISGNLFIEADGKELIFAMSTHDRNAVDQSTDDRWLLSDKVEGGASRERMIIIDRNSGTISYSLHESVRDVTATGTCAKVDMSKKLF